MQRAMQKNNHAACVRATLCKPCGMVDVPLDYSQPTAIIRPYLRWALKRFQRRTTSLNAVTFLSLHRLIVLILLDISLSIMVSNGLLIFRTTILIHTQGMASTRYSVLLTVGIGNMSGLLPLIGTGGLKPFSGSARILGTLIWDDMR